MLQHLALTGIRFSVPIESAGPPRAFFCVRHPLRNPSAVAQSAQLADFSRDEDAGHAY